MKSKPASPASQSTIAEKDSGKSVKALHKKLLVDRAPIKLRASSGKCVAKRTRDKSPKLSASGPSHRLSITTLDTAKSSIPLGAVRSSASRASSAGKSKGLTPKQPADNAMSKKVIQKKTGTSKARKQRKETGGRRKATTKLTSPNTLIDLWAFASTGKREASLNASIKVNIMFEKHSSSKSAKTKKIAQDIRQDDNMKDRISGRGDPAVGISAIQPGRKKSSDSVQDLGSIMDKACAISPDHKRFSGKQDRKKVVIKSKHCDGSSRKRKSPGYQIFKEELPAKARKLDKHSLINSQKKMRKSKKLLPSGHQLCNIIEKCPRQASLVARAMIAMEQEEDAGHDSAARTQVYDWMERRSLAQTGSRRIEWHSGLGPSATGKTIQKQEDLQSSKDNETSTDDVDVGSQKESQIVSVENESLHNALLRTLHQIGDGRLLKECLRAQKDDFQGHVDVEKCPTPEKPSLPSPDPKKKLSSPVSDAKPDKEIDKPVTCSPVKLQPCRVSTPIPQFPVGQRSSNLSSSFIHQPVPQAVFPSQHSHAHPQSVNQPVPQAVFPSQHSHAHPQSVNQPVPQAVFPSQHSHAHPQSINQPVPQAVFPSQHSHAHHQSIKVSPYAPSPTYIYQYHPQGTLYAPSSPSPYGVGSSEAAHREYTSTYTLSHIDSLSLSRRGVSPYQPTPAYSTSLHLPIQQIGFNYGAYYPTSIQPLPQQNLPAIPIHQQYPLIQTPVITHQIPPDVAHPEAYQHEYPPYAPLPVGQDGVCMPPPPLPILRPTPMTTPPVPPRRVSGPHPVRPPASPIEALRLLNPVVRPPALDFSANVSHQQGNLHDQFPVFTSCRPHPQLNRDHPISSSFKYSVTCNGLNKSFSPCKKEHDDASSSYDCDVNNKTCVYNSQCLPRPLESSRTMSEGSDISDLLHSAHTTMYQIDGLNSMENIRDYHQAQPAVTHCTVGSSSKLSIMGHSSFNASYSVSSILDMPSCKVKAEPGQKVCSVPHLSNLPSTIHQIGQQQPLTAPGLDSKETNDKPPPPIAPKVQPSNKIDKQGDTPGQNNYSCNQASNNDNRSENSETAVIVIEDTDESSDDDEPLARLVKVKSAHHSQSHISEADGPGKLNKPKLSTSHIPKEQQKIKSKHGLKRKVSEHTKTADLVQEVKLSSVKLRGTGGTKNTTYESCDDKTFRESRVNTQLDSMSTEGLRKPQSFVKSSQGLNKPQSSVTSSQGLNKSQSSVTSSQGLNKSQSSVTSGEGVSQSQSLGTGSEGACQPQSLGTNSEDVSQPQSLGTDSEDVSQPQSLGADREDVSQPQSLGTDSEGKLNGDKVNKNKAVPRKTALNSSTKVKKPAKKIKVQPVWPLTPTKVNTNHGWSWIGQGHIKPVPKITQAREELVRIRSSYQSMRHTSGEIVSVRDNVILQSDGDGSVPFVAKVSSLWENLNGEMMFSMLWYYQPEHTSAGREAEDGDQELFASKHREENSVACIDDKCYVLMYNEYCRLEAEGVRLEQGAPVSRWKELMPKVTEDDKRLCRPPPPANACADNIWFCRYDYDIRKKVVWKPKHKKSNLRYRVPFKVV